ncbi:hypothetical protein BV22DRAFT_1198540 [Leucogyrophana mollusca]|uniref:Uncharacterized protein n=1 Tax=Leucogyrophana mollusca TaxID=85980 RepID=A0ACB8B5B1_9AGAM|nr:hypothetical protein BV22DRAFT_1198540 [Leucogyrophana mollusca]
MNIDPVEYSRLLRAKAFYRDRCIERGHREIPGDIMASAISDLRTSRARNTSIRVTPAWTGVNPATRAPARTSFNPLTRADLTSATPWTPVFNRYHGPVPPARQQRWRPRRPARRPDRGHPSGGALRGANPGIQVDSDALPRNIPPSWRPRINPREAPMTQATPALPLRQPDVSTWNFPTGTLGWCLHQQSR